MACVWKGEHAVSDAPVSPLGECYMYLRVFTAPFAMTKLLTALANSDIGEAQAANKCPSFSTIAYISVQYHVCASITLAASAAQRAHLLHKSLKVQSARCSKLLGSTVADDESSSKEMKDSSGTGMVSAAQLLPAICMLIRAYK